MNPRRLRLRNLRTFAELDLELPDGRIAILGGNGAGKSTLATAVDWALFGPDGRSFAAYLSQGTESSEMLLQLDFEHGGHDYRVTRTYSSRGSGKTTLDLERDPGGSGQIEMLTRETVKQTQEHLEQLLGLNRQTFRASSMLVQGDGAAFTEALPRDRKQILARILALERWDGYLADARAQIRQLETAITDLNGRIGGADDEVDQLPETRLAIEINRGTIADATAKGEKAAADLKVAEAFLRDATAAAASRAAAVARVAQAEQTVAPLRDRDAAARSAAAHRQTTLEEMDTVMTADQIAEQIRLANEQIEDARSAKHRHERAVAEIRTRNAVRDDLLERKAKVDGDRTRAMIRIDALLTMAAAHRDPESPTGAETCPHCGQPLISPAARDHAANVLETEAAQLQATARGLAEEYDRIELSDAPEELPDEPTDLADRVLAATRMADLARAASEQRATLEERARMHAAIAERAPDPAELETAARALQAAQDALAALPEAVDQARLEAAQTAAGDAERARDEERVRWQAATADLARLEERLARIEKVAESVNAWAAERNRAHADLDELAVLEHAYGRDGIPAWIVATVAIPAIEIEATRILAELGTSYRCELRTERATGAGDVVDALDVIVTTPDGERPYETFSGGERTRINLALRIALARLLATRRASASRLLVIDEPEFLDGAGTAALVGVLRGLDDFDRIWLISHVPDLRDAALDGTLEVTRDEAGWSTVTAS